MSFKACPKCGHQIDSTHVRCNYCGERLVQGNNEVSSEQDAAVEITGQKASSQLPNEQRSLSGVVWYTGPEKKIKHHPWLRRMTAICLIFLTLFIYQIPMVALGIHLRTGGGWIAWILQGIVWRHIWYSVIDYEKSWKHIVLWTILGPLVCAILYLVLGTIIWGIIVPSTYPEILPPSAKM